MLLDAKDNLMGATLIRGPQKDGAKLRFIRWRIEDQTKYLEIGTHDVPWPFQSEISQSVLGVGPGGSACALLCDQEGQWSVFDPSGGFRKAPPSIAKTKFPLGLSYLNSADCVILSGQMQQGFRLMMLNGDPLPHLCG